MPKPIKYSKKPLIWKSKREKNIWKKDKRKLFNPRVNWWLNNKMKWMLSRKNLKLILTRDWSLEKMNMENYFKDIRMLKKKLATNKQSKCPSLKKLMPTSSRESHKLLRDQWWHQKWDHLKWKQSNNQVLQHPNHLICEMLFALQINSFSIQSLWKILWSPFDNFWSL